MNIIVLESDPRELAFIQQALDGKRHHVAQASASGKAWSAVQAGGVRFLIVNDETTDAGTTNLIQRIRDAQSPDPLYILLITSRNIDDAPAVGADDVLRRPYQKTELKNRITIAERIIALTSSLVSAREELDTQAAFDGLTGFLNQSGFLRQASGELERSRRASSPFCLIALNIDNFKIINDKFGGRAGDDVLKAAAKSIREKSRPYDCIGRWAGDEFVLALPNVIGADGEKIAERIIAGVRSTRIEVPKEPPLNVKVSAGIAAIMRITSTTEVTPLIQQAQGAVARAKAAGGNQVYLVFL